MAPGTIQPDIVAALERIVGADNVVRHRAERMVYECDAFTLVRNPPELVLLPRRTEHVAQAVRLLAENKIPFVPRGAGTGLAGGTVSPPGAVMIGLNRLTRIRRIDLRNRFAEVEAGVVNLKLNNQLAPHGYQFAPDPSSQMACTIGGNTATNAGGPHTLKYGVTANHVLGLELVMPDGEVVRTGDASGGSAGLDLTGLIVGGEGTLGIVTAVTVRLTRLPQAVRTALAVFETVDDATQSVADITATGIVPAAMEMMDSGVIEAVEAAFHIGLPLDAGAVLLIEVDGHEAGIERQMRSAAEICRKNHARDVRIAKDEQERLKIWKARKRAAGAFGRLTTSYCTQDGVVPRSQLPDMLREIAEIAKRHGVRIANLVHAGDGNIHPIVMFDERDAQLVRRALDASGDILRACIRRGGTITGEHGVGVEKIEYMPLLFTADELAHMLTIRKVFNPAELCNPYKIFPDSKGCWEIQKPGKRVIV